MKEEANKDKANKPSAASGSRGGASRWPGGNSGGAGRGRGAGGGRRGGGPRRERRQQITTSAPEYDSKTLSIDRVSRMQAGGRRFRFRSVVAIGNKKGSVGVGVGKAPDIRAAIEKATRRAHENKITVPRVKGTIPREIEIKLGTSRIILRPARPGHGIVAGGVVRTICELAGITDISTKILSRSSNNLSNARATMAGLEKLAERVAIAKARAADKPGKKEDKKEPVEVV